MLKEFNYHTRVMGCDFDLTFLTKDISVADQCFTRAVEMAEFYEKKFSRFNANSELSILNTAKSMAVTKEFFDVYEMALSLYRETSGIFNPLLQVSQIGYTKSFEKISSGDESLHIGNLRYNQNINDIVVNRDTITLQNDQLLDFGGFLKGYVVEKIAQELHECMDLIVNIGGDLFAKGKDENNENFVIEIEHPLDEKKNIFVSVNNEALCTSGTYKRKWIADGEKYHHIIDSMTRRNSKTDIISASVMHSSGSYADAYATYAISVGSKKAEKFFISKNINFVLICENGAIIKSANLNLKI